MCITYLDISITVGIRFFFLISLLLTLVSLLDLETTGTADFRSNIVDRVFSSPVSNEIFSSHPTILPHREFSHPWDLCSVWGSTSQCNASSLGPDFASVLVFFSGAVLFTLLLLSPNTKSWSSLLTPCNHHKRYK